MDRDVTGNGTGSKMPGKERIRAGKTSPSVLMISAEATPYAKVGGLADVVGALPGKLGQKGLRTSVFLPFYREVGLRGFQPEPTGVVLRVPHGGSDRRCEVFVHERRDTRFFFLSEPGLFDREWIYGPPGGEYPDSAIRYSFLCKASLMAAEAMNLAPQILHCHDWHASLVPIFTGHGVPSPGWLEIPVLLTIHNLAYQGVYGSQVQHSLGLPSEAESEGKMLHAGRLNLLRAGILSADMVSTVSPAYAQEIQTIEHGQGLEGTLRELGGRLKGILNGVDYDVWDPMTDASLVAPFSASDPSGRRRNREALQQQLNLYPGSETPLLAFVGRLVHQKGADILSRLIDRIVEEGIQLAVLGTGEFHLEESLLGAAKSHAGMVSVSIGFNDTLARRIYGSSDFFLMPSRFEPCGLGQMISMRYGSIPIARETGGLKDTIVDLDRDPETGNGFLFKEPDEASLWESIGRATRFFREGGVPSIIGRVMSEDHSWERSAGMYADLYREMLSAKKP